MVQWAPISVRKPWCNTAVVELLPGAVPPWWESLLWSGEATTRLHLTYPYEGRILAAAVRAGLERQVKALGAAFENFRLAPPAAPTTHQPTPAYVLGRFPPPHSCSSRDEPDLTIDATLPFDDLEGGA